MTGDTLDVEALPAVEAPGPAGPVGPRRALRVALVVVLLALCALQLRALLRSGYSNDDVANSQIPMQTAADGRSLLQYWGDQTDFWQHEHGRFIPISGLETIVVFSALTTRHAYKVFQVLAAVGALGVFVAFVRRFTGDLWAALLGGMVAVAAVQVRAWNDPWLQYNAQQPTALVLVLAALGAFVAFVRTGRVRWLATALVPWTLVLMLYETTWLFIVLFPLLALGAPTSRRGRTLACAAMALPLLVLGLYVSSLRSDAAEVSDSYTTSLAPGAVVPAFVKQVASALPLTYATLGPAPAERPWTADALWPDLADLVVVLGAVALVQVAWPRMGSLSRLVRWQLAGVGAAFTVFPAALVATTVRWQQELRPGLGYVSVYVQTFGLALLAVAALAWWRERRGAPPPRWWVAPVAVAVAMALVVTQHTNQRAVDALQSLRWDREVLADAIRGGLLDDVGDGDGVLSLRLHGWIDPAFVQWYGGPHGPVQFEPPPGCRPLRLDCLRAGGLGWAMTPEYGTTAHTGHVLLGPIDDVTTEPTGEQVVLVPRLAAWVRDPSARAADAAPGAVAPDVVIRVFPPDGGPAVTRAAAPDELTVARAGKGWWLLGVTPAAGLLDAEFLEVSPPVRA